MPGRSFTANNSSYRYSFNGKETDNEIAGVGSSIHFEFREYDPRIGRMKSIDQKASEYPWQSPYAYHRNSPVNIADYLGLGDPPVTAYHNTSVGDGVKILDRGFNAPSGWNYFMTDPSGTKAGAGVADQPVQFKAAINTEGAKTIKYEQWRGFFNEAKAELGLSDVDNAKLSKDQLKQLNAMRNDKARLFMKNEGGDAFIIEAEKAGKSSQKFIVLTEEAVKSRVTSVSVPKGQELLVSEMEKSAAAGGTAFSRANAGSKMFRYGKMALRFVGEGLLIEGAIYGIRSKGEAAQHYVERKSLNGHSAFYNWMMDTYSDVGLYYWYKYSVDLKQ